MTQIIQYILPAIFTLLIAPIITGLILYLIKKERLSLQYDLIESELFPLKDGKGKYFVIKLKNLGNKAIEKGSLEISFDAGEIETFTVSEERLISDIQQAPSQVKASLPLLNPKENLSITITAKANPSISSPKIVARAVGVTATQIKREETIFYYNYKEIIVAVIITATISSYTIYQWSIYRLNSINVKIDEIVKSQITKLQGEPERQDIIFAVLNKAGLSHVFPQLISSNGEITYKNTGFFLMHSFLFDQNDGQKYISAIEGLLEIKDIAPGSRGMLFYLLAKMEQARGNNTKALEYFAKCKNEAPLMYEHLMGQDPAYDLQSLKNWLQKNWKL